MKIVRPVQIALTSSNVADSSYPLWDSTTSYSVGDLVYLNDNHGEYQALTANTGINPLDNPTDWQWLGTTDRWRMFDQYLNTVTSNVGSIVVEIVPAYSNAIYLGNLYCNTVTIEVIDNATSTVIETYTQDMVEDVVDWQDYLYGSWINQKKSIVMYERTTLTTDVTFKVTLDAGTDMASCGIVVCGNSIDIGYTLFDLQASALDFSKVVTDTNTGVTFLEKGNYAKTINADIFTRTANADVVYRLLTEISGTPVVFVGGGEYETLSVFGFVQKFETAIKSSQETIIALQLQGLI